MSAGDNHHTTVSNTGASSSTISTSGLQQILAISTSLTNQEEKPDLQPVDEEVMNHRSCITLHYTRRNLHSVATAEFFVLFVFSEEKVFLQLHPEYSWRSR